MGKPRRRKLRVVSLSSACATGYGCDGGVHEGVCDGVREGGAVEGGDTHGQAGQRTPRNDTVLAAVSYTLGNDIVNLTLIGTDAVNASGNALVNALTGKAGANALDGAQGADTMAGGAGDDIYFVDHAADVVLEKTDEGMDAVYSTVNYTLDEHVENLDLAAGAASGVGNALDNRLTGNSGANLLSGGADDDTLKGGAGNDLIHTGRGADIIAFNRGGGRDTILASAGKDNTVSLANGIVYADLLFTKSGNDLVLETGAK